MEVDGKGHGCVASHNIPKGTVILCEKPQFYVRGGRSEWMKDYWLKNMMNNFFKLTLVERKDFFKLFHGNVPLQIKHERKSEIKVRVIEESFY